MDFGKSSHIVRHSGQNQGRGGAALELVGLMEPSKGLWGHASSDIFKNHVASNAFPAF